ncbi:MAG: hypothetical protein E6J20_19910 [Chloroflexi bacterium]|nr:MAG: hypothetical protein E6J20_19910 [Chloroflexota bacterium]
MLGRAGSKWPSAATLNRSGGGAAADAAEAHATLSYRASRALAPVVAEAASRADAAARLEAALRSASVR